MKVEAITRQFKVEDYKYRLRLLREINNGDNQVEFAERLGIPFKRWNNYERGYPVPREIAFLLVETFPGLSIEWLWFGWPGNLRADWTKKIEAAEALARQQLRAEREVAKAQDKLKKVTAKRRKKPQSS